MLLKWLPKFRETVANSELDVTEEKWVERNKKSADE
jgi:hypothetical protein